MNQNDAKLKELQKFKDETSLGRKNQHRENKHFKVVVTQPRKIAAIQMAKRVSQERNCSLGR